jgi:hypothetical protein
VDTLLLAAAFHLGEGLETRSRHDCQEWQRREQVVTERVSSTCAIIHTAAGT